MKKKSFMNVIIGAVILIIIAAGVYIFMHKTESPSENSSIVKYGNYTFVLGEDNSWSTTMNIRKVPYTLAFHYNPTELQNVSLDSPNTIEKIKTFRQFHPTPKIYITVDPDASSLLVLGGIDIAKILGTSYNIYNYNVSSAFSKPSFDTNYPVITCANGTGSTMVIWIVVDNENKISSSNNCIIVESATENESVKVSDALAYRLLNIIH